MTTRCIVASVFSLIMVSPVSATPPRVFALVVGIDRCADEHVQPRQHAEKDAQALAELLDHKPTFGEPVQLTLLLGGKNEQPASKDNILKTLRDICGRAGQDDLVLFSFIGQGAPAGQGLCLFAADSTVAERTKNAVQASELAQELDRLQSRRFCALLDVNFKGFDAGAEKVAEPNLAGLFRTFLGRDDRDDQPPPAGRVLCLASNGRRASLDLEANGLFTQVIREGLRGSADVDGYEADGAVTAEELVAFLVKRVPELAKMHGAAKEDKEQAPVVIGSRSNHFTLARHAAPAEKTGQRLEKFAGLVQEHGLADDLAAEGQRLLDRMPLGPGEQELRKLYQGFVDGTVSAADFPKRREQVLASNRQVRIGAQAYAEKVLEMVRLVQRDYVRELSQAEMIGWAGLGLCQRAGAARVLTEFKERFDRSRKLTEGQQLQLLAEARERIGRHNALPGGRDAELSMLEVGGRLDPYSGYVDSQRLADFKRLVTGAHIGIGVRLVKDPKRDVLQVVTPLKNSPAYKAGLRGGDLITHIIREADGTGKALPQPDIAATKGLPIGEATTRLGGRAGSRVILIVERPGVEPFHVTVTRGAIEEETVLGVRRRDNDDWDFMLDAEKAIGYVRLTQFHRQSTAEFKKALTDLDKAGLRGLVLDLRFNPGGLLQTATDISRLFIDDGLIVTVRPRSAPVQTFLGDPAARYQKFPMVVLVNGQSASASELVGACLQDHGRAIVVGERSFGKGSVQNYMDYHATGGLLRLTVATFWRPSGRNLHKGLTRGTDAEDWGVQPNEGFAVKLSAQERDVLFKYLREVEVIPRRDGQPVPEHQPSKDRQLDAALQHLRGLIEARPASGSGAG